MEDIKIKTDTQKFKYRVNGIILHNRKILTLKMGNNASYYLPGGHVEFGEDSRTAVIREMFEETETPVIIDKEFAVVENFYLDKNSLQTHEISFYYIVKPENFDKMSLQNYVITENDKGEMKNHNFEWLDISSLKDLDFRPEFIKEKLISHNFDFEHIIIK